MVHEYTGLNFEEIDQLNLVDYLLYRRDAFIFKMNQTEKGREYLDNAWRLTQTEPDKKSLREAFGKGD